MRRAGSKERFGKSDALRVTAVIQQFIGSGQDKPTHRWPASRACRWGSSVLTSPRRAGQPSSILTQAYVYVVP